ncbi:cell division protein SepF [Sediminibacillus albus]|uniref:Cell division protein SepF n=1 Tax=Sediminibacillus albus TaxID=407036 RepID=A0A1G8W6J2_9BACI|nr:cell division protein SepF [Sediminibacillus albus]SDJ73899.1 cell division inhibitor SepF [Sediminibacillus albus]
MSIKDKIKTFFTLDDEYEYVEEEELEVPETASSQKDKSKNIVSLKSVQPSSKVVLLEPRTYSEAQEIADNIVNRRAVVINLQRVDHSQAKRIVDFLSGTVYAVSGDIQKLGTHTFLCTPDNVDVSGTISDMLNEEDLDKRW